MPLTEIEIDQGCLSVARPRSASAAAASSLPGNCSNVKVTSEGREPLVPLTESKTDIEPSMAVELLASNVSYSSLIDVRQLR